jgi:hypothetical protein
MATTKTTKTRTAAVGSPRYVTRGEAYEIVDDLIRKAISENARDLEKHLADIHNRLVDLEKK